MIEHYRQLIDDPVRLGAFQRAIAGVVRPGDVVADIGCGLGTYAIFAARAGARRVFAVEDPEGHLRIDRFHWSKDRVVGIDFSSTRRRVFASPHARKLGAGALVAAPELAHDYDLLHLKRVEVSATRTLTASRPGVVHGL